MLQGISALKPFTSGSRPCKFLPPNTRKNRHLHTAIQGTSDSSQHTPQVKICGITSVQDAKLAASAGADMLGMIMWQQAKRAVSASVARDIASVAEDHGIQSVGVFVDENAQQIQAMCGESGIQVAQLHGKGARQALCQLPENLHVVYVMNSDDHGIIQTPSPAQLAEQSEQVLSRHVQWLLIDGQQGGSGQTLPWSKLKVPDNLAEKGWLLAGGLNPDNVAEAVSELHPTVVDVSSGVTQHDGITKDKQKVAAFIAAVKQGRQ